MAEEEGTGDQDNPWAGGPEVCMGGTPKGQMTSWARSSQGRPSRKEKGSAIGRRANASPRAEAEAVGRGKVQPGARGGQYVGVTGGESQTAPGDWGSGAGCASSARRGGCGGGQMRGTR